MGVFLIDGARRPFCTCTKFYIFRQQRETLQSCNALCVERKLNWLSNHTGPVPYLSRYLERWTSYGGSIRPGFKSPGFEARRAPDVYRGSWRVWLRLVAGRSQSESAIGTGCARLCAYVNPRPAGVWLVTRPAGGGGGGAKGPPPEISQTTGPISKFQTPFDSPVRELPVQGQIFDPEVTDDVTGQVKVRIFDFSGLATSASKISMLSANKANESAWIVSLTSVSIISCAL